MVFGRKKDPMKEAADEEEKARAALEQAAAKRRELEERNAKTPLIMAANGEEAAEKVDPPTPPEPPKFTAEQERLARLVQEWSDAYEGAFPELGPSAHASVERSLLLAIYGELRLLRVALKK